MSGRAVCDRRTIQCPRPRRRGSEYPVASRHAKRDGHRTTLATPLLREGVPIGAILIRRQEVRPSPTSRSSWSRTSPPGRHRHREHAACSTSCAKALEQQTATSEVLQVISSSPGELEPVFQAMLENATRICEAKFGTLLSATRAMVFASSRCTMRRRHLVEEHASASRAFRPAAAIPAWPSSCDQAGRSISPTSGEQDTIEMRADRSSHGRPRLGGARLLSPCRCSRTTS